MNTSTAPVGVSSTNAPETFPDVFPEPPSISGIDAIPMETGPMPIVWSTRCDVQEEKDHSFLTYRLADCLNPYALVGRISPVFAVQASHVAASRMVKPHYLPIPVEDRTS